MGNHTRYLIFYFRRYKIKYYDIEEWVDKLPSYTEAVKSFENAND